MVHQTVNNKALMRTLPSGRRRVPPGPRRTLRLSKDTVRMLHAIRLSAAFPMHSLGSWAMPIALSVLANGALVALGLWPFDGRTVTPPVERAILVTVLDREPVLDNPRQGVALPSEPRTTRTAGAAEVPPPPARNAPNVEFPALVLRLARHADPVASAPMWNNDPPASGHASPVPGPGRMGAFWQQVRQLIAAKAVYPPAAVRRNASGQVILRVRIDPRGKLTQVNIATSSSDGALDRAALSAVREAAPFPVGTLGAGAGTNGLEALIPVRFELVDGPANGLSDTMSGMR